jgi:hypothetical protein
MTAQPPCKTKRRTPDQEGGYEKHWVRHEQPQRCDPIVCVHVSIIAALTFAATIERSPVPKIVIGCLILIAFVLAIAGVLGFGGGVTASPESIIIFAVGVLVLVAVLYLVDLFLGWLAANMGLGAPIVEAIRFIITVVALIALILIAGSALIGGGSSNFFSFRGGERHGALQGNANWASTGPLRDLRDHTSIPSAAYST